MAKKSKVVKNNHRYEIVKRYESKRKKLKEIIKDPKTSLDEKRLANMQLEKLPRDSKQSLLWLYRLHNPNIELFSGIRDTLDSLFHMKSNVSILTDGRSVTQRLKVKSLGLNNLPVYISEEYSSEKPAKKRFLEIQKDFPNKKYVYIADNPVKDFQAPLEMDWICIGANWIKNRISERTTWDGAVCIALGLLVLFLTPLAKIAAGVAIVWGLWTIWKSE